MTVPSSGHSRVPPGFRFHPTDEELVNYYLKKKVALEKFELDVIGDVDLNKLEPWDLHERCKLDSTPQTEWYFFSHKDKKYPTGTRTNRATAAGFWKATGRDKAVHSNFKRIGMRKTLVFYRGRAPHGQKTDWIMHEYRLEESESGARGNEDGWVVCRVFKKRNHQPKGHENHFSRSEDVGLLDKLDFCKNFPGDTSLNQQFSCKQEFGFEDYALPQVPFLQLPHLESPKISYNPSCSNPLPDANRALAENSKRGEFPPTFSLDLTPTEGTKSLFISEDCLTDYGDGGHLPEWGMLETISKEIRYNAEMNNFSGDISYPLQRQPASEYLSSCDVELWNFTR